MERGRVVGIGGIFVKAQDPVGLRAWYRDNLGFDIHEWGGAELHNRAGSHGVWAAFAGDTKYFEPSEKAFMINFRVDDLDPLLERLRARGARVLDRREDAPFGAFGYVVDPEGTLIELWQPKEAATPAP